MRDFTKVTLQEMLSLNIWEKVKQPDYIYHLTGKNNLDSIIADGYIHTGTDYVCWFFPEKKNVIQYLTITNAFEGRKYHDFDGTIHTAPPFIPSENVLLKLIPRYKEPDFWYKENNVKRGFADSSGKPLSGNALQTMIDKYTIFDNCRIAHYGKMKFKKEIEVIEMVDVLAD